MNSIKMIFFDIDGTLVDPATGKISEKTQKTLHRLHKRGIRLAIATGRPSASLPDFGDLPFGVFCAFNGSLCYTAEETIHTSPLPRDAVKQVLENAAAIGRPVSVATKDRLVANGLDPDLGDYYRLAGLTLTVADDFDPVCREDVYQIMLGCRESDHPAIIQGIQGVKLAVSWDRAADVIPAASGKGASIRKILDHFQLETSEVMAFGDSYNDIEMLQTVGTGVAMGNAPEAVKAIADDVCGPVGEEGIYHYCIQHGLI